MCFIPHYSGKVSLKGHFYPVGNENPLGEDSLPFCNLYTRNPIGLTHCAVHSPINLYPMQWMLVLYNHLVTPIDRDSWVRTMEAIINHKTCCQ